MPDTVVVAVGAHNQLTQEEINGIKKLRKGTEVILVGYMDQYPAQFTAIPSVNIMIKHQKEATKKVMEKTQQELGIPQDHVKYVSETLGATGVKSLAKDLDAPIITHDKSQLQSAARRLFGMKEIVPLLDFETYRRDYAEKTTEKNSYSKMTELDPKEKAGATKEPELTKHEDLWQKPKGERKKAFEQESKESKEEKIDKESRGPTFKR